MGKGEGNTKLAMEISEENLGKETAGKYTKFVDNYSKISTAVCKKEIKSFIKRLKKLEKSKNNPIKTKEQKCKEKFELVKLDCELVHREIIDIKTCRTNIFMGTLGVLGAVGVGILSVVGLNDKTSLFTWLPWAAAVPIILLIIAMLATIHKARGLTERVGYFRAVYENLIKQRIPKGFCGWFTARLVVEQCQYNLQQRNKMLNDCPDSFVEQLEKCFQKNNRIVDNCPVSKQIDQNKKHKSEPYCVTKARKDSWIMNEDVNIIPPFLHSFTSFSTYVFSIAFILAVLALFVAISNMLKRQIADINISTYWRVVAGSALVTSLLGYYTFKRKVKSYKQSVETGIREKNTITGYIFKVYTYIVLCMFPAFLGILLSSVFGKELESLDIWQALSLYGFVFVIIAIAGAISESCYNKVYSLRKGRYSPERWYCLWKTCLEDCPLMKIAQEESESK